MASPQTRYKIPGWPRWAVSYTFRQVSWDGRVVVLLLVNHRRARLWSALTGRQPDD